jgi:pimeloyl-ACP methyl ester carboxylesterase
VPVLILFGADDALVPPQESVANTVRLLKTGDRANVVVHVFAHADHTLRVPPAEPDGWPHNAPGFPQIIASFAKNPGGLAP